jgi:hypothetical protein
VFCCQFNPQSTILVRACHMWAPVVCIILRCTALAIQKQAQLHRLLSGSGCKCAGLC